jgi:hypothetical protein
MDPPGAPPQAQTGSLSKYTSLNTKSPLQSEEISDSAATGCGDVSASNTIRKKTDIHSFVVRNFNAMRLYPRCGARWLDFLPAAQDRAYSRPSNGVFARKISRDSRFPTIVINISVLPDFTLNSK